MAKKCKTCKKDNKYPLNKYCCFDCTPSDHFSKKFHEVKIKKTEVAKIGKKKMERLKNGGGETLTFKKVNNIDTSCWICGACVDTTAPLTYPHLLSKGKYPAFRNFTNNIGRACCIEHHAELDSKIVKLTKDFEETELLKKLVMVGERQEVKDLVLKY